MVFHHWLAVCLILAQEPPAPSPAKADAPTASVEAEGKSTPSRKRVE